MTDTSNKSRVLRGGVLAGVLMLVAGAAHAADPPGADSKDKAQTKPANAASTKAKTAPVETQTMNGVGTNASASSPNNPGAGSAWGGVASTSSTVNVPGGGTLQTGGRSSSPGGVKLNAGNTSSGTSGWGAPTTTGLNTSGTTQASKGGGGTFGIGTSGVNLNNGGTAGVRDDANSDNKGVVDTIVDGMKSAWNSTVGASGTPGTEVNKAMNGNDSGGADGGSKKGGHRTIPIYTPPGKKDGGSSVDDRDNYGAGGRSAANGGTINLGNRGGGDAGGKGGGGGQTDQGGTSGAGGRSAANGATVNLGAKAGGDAPLKKPTDKGVLDSSKVTNGAVDPKLGTGGPGG